MMDNFKNIENFGIDLKLETEEAEMFYCETLRQWFMDDKGYVTISVTDREFELAVMIVTGKHLSFFSF